MQGVMMETIETESIHLTGEVERILFQKDEFCIFRFKTNKDTVKCVGNVYLVQGEGERLELSGKWIEHKKFGRQFEVEQWEKPIPTGEDGIVAFLKLLKGVGESTAKRIVKALGETAIERIIADGEALLKTVPKLGTKKAASIAEQVRDNAEVQQYLVKLMKLGLSATIAMKAFKHFGKECVDIVQKNPYQLMELDLIGFVTADKIALKMGIPETSGFRLSSALLHVINEQTYNTGHCYIDRDTWLLETQKLLQQGSQGAIPWELLDTNAAELEAKRAVIVEGDEDVYPKRLWNAETFVAKFVRSRMNQSAKNASFCEWIERYEAEYDVELAPEQKQAVEMALNHDFFVLTGGPGTGKTTTLKAILWCYRQLCPKSTIALTAPTGRAARRMEEATGYQASTIHRLLNLNPQDGEIGYDSKNPLPYSLVVVDEVSMLDVVLADHLFDAIAPKTKLILVGDADQLPSVGPGYVLNDLLQSSVPSVQLQQVFRQAQESNIVVNAHRILRGERLQQGKDFFFVGVNRDSTEEANLAIRDRLLQGVRNLLAQGHTVDDIQVLTATKKTAIGVNELNVELQKIMNPAGSGKTEMKHGERLFRVGDKVMQTKNDYEREVYNGEVGRIVEIDLEDGVVIVNFANVQEVQYERDELGQLQHAYACTIHKSQGGEYKAVLIPMSTSQYMMLYQNLLYTAVTRAKELCGIIGEKRAVSIAVKNNKPVQRNTGLVGKITFSKG